MGICNGGQKIRQRRGVRTRSDEEGSRRRQHRERVSNMSSHIIADIVFNTTGRNERWSCGAYQTLALRRHRRTTFLGIVAVACDHVRGDAGRFKDLSSNRLRKAGNRISERRWPPGRRLDRRFRHRSTSLIVKPRHAYRIWRCRSLCECRIKACTGLEARAYDCFACLVFISLLHRE
jgi:hypothetical protein